MKKLFTLAILFFVAFGAFSQAKSGAIKVNPIGLIVGFINVGYEKPFSEKNSGQLNLGLISADFGSTSLSGFGVRPEFRMYSQEALDGFYWGPVVGFNSFTAKNDDSNDEATVSSFGAGAKLGWNWLLGASDNFVIDLGLGAQYLTNSVNVKSGNEDDLDFGGFDGFAPIINFSIGYAFD